MKLNFNKILKKIDNYLLPSHCLICSRPGNILCPACRVKIKVLTPHCPMCGQRSSLGFICLNCQKQEPNLYFEAVFALGKYEQTNLKLSLQALKYKGLRPLALILGRLLGRYFQPQWHSYNNIHQEDEKEVIIMPIPLHKRRLREKGFNPAQLLAQALTEICPWPLDCNLKRRWYKKPNTNSFKQKKLFVYKGDNILINKTIILIDDVFDTGTTANAAAYALKQAGAKKVIVLVAAKNI